MLFGKTLHVDFDIGRLQVTSDIICGIINVGFIIACLMIIHAEPKNGLYASILLIFLALVPAFLTLIINHNYAVLPGVITDISAIPLLIIYSRQIRSILEEERKLKTLSVTDPLTGLLNQRGLRKSLDEFIEKKTTILSFIYRS